MKQEKPPEGGFSGHFPADYFLLRREMRQ